MRKGVGCAVLFSFLSILQRQRDVSEREKVGGEAESRGRGFIFVIRANVGPHKRTLRGECVE